jgi:hypothetical protein
MGPRPLLAFTGNKLNLFEAAAPNLAAGHQGARAIVLVHASALAGVSSCIHVVFNVAPGIQTHAHIHMREPRNAKRPKPGPNLKYNKHKQLLNNLNPKKGLVGPVLPECCGPTSS